jgi:PAS domain S-box-containing protein
MLSPDQAAAVLDCAADGVLVTDQSQPGHPIIYANAAFARLTGYPTDAIIGRNCRFLQNDDRAQPEIAEMKSAIADGRPATVTLRNYRRDGSVFWNEVRLAPLRRGNRCTGHFVGFQRDVSNRVEADRRLRDSLAAASAANRSKARLLTAINHEFRTPIGIITGFAEVLLAANQRGQPEPRQTEFLRDLHAAAFHLLELVNDTRTYMEMTEAGPALHRAPARLSTIVEDAIARASVKIAAGRIRLAANNSAADVVVNVDAVLLRQALVNLITEIARKAPPTSMIEILAAEGPPASVRLHCAALVLPPGTASEILEPFGTGSDPYARGLEGAQISVAVAAAIIRLLGGELRIDSDIVHGTRLSVTIPVLTR